MLDRIVSGGQTGADLAALDAAIEAGLSYRGWIAKGRKTEQGPLPQSYLLDEMPTESYEDRTERNVLDSDGTLVVSHGELKGGSALTRDLAMRHGRPCLHVDLERTSQFKAAAEIAEWVANSGIKALNVAGSRASQNPGIYEAVKRLMRTVIHLDRIRSNSPHLEFFGRTVPKTSQEAVLSLISDLSLKDKVAIGRMDEGKLNILEPRLGGYIKSSFRVPENKALAGSCRTGSGKELDEEGCIHFIIKELWKALRESHGLRLVSLKDDQN